MLNAKRLMIAVIALMSIGAGTAFAGWTSSQTGHCHYPNYTFHPFLDWSYPGADEQISGTWNTEVQGLQGTYDGDLDSTVTDHCETKAYYHGQWSVDSTPFLGGFFLVKRTVWGTNFEWWSGTWKYWSLTPPSDSGTMTGTYEDPSPSHYLIIYADIFDGNPDLNLFAERKREKGFDVEMKMLGSINGVIYDENPDVQAIREYIRNEWYNPDWILPSYVLLVGDPIGVGLHDGYKAEWADPEHLPTQQFMYPDEFRGTSDYWFQLMDDEDDTSDVALGRWCVNNDQELNTMVSKTFDYENPDPALGWEPNRTLLVAHWCNSLGEPTTDLADSSEIIRQMFENWNIPGYEAYTAYAQAPPDKGGPDPAAGPNNDTIRGYLEGNVETNGIGVLNYIGHGLVSQYNNGWSTWNAWREWFSNDTVYSLTQTHHGYPLVYQFCCYTGAIAVGGDGLYGYTALCEAWTLHPDGGAVGALGSSGNASCGGDELSTPMAKGIFSALFEDNMDCGWAIIKGGTDFRKANVDFEYAGYSGNPDSIKKRRVFTTYWIGDPELDVWRNVPQNATMTGEVTSDSQYLVTVLRSSDNASVQGAKVCDYCPGVCQDVGYTDSAGQVYLPWYSNPGTYYFTATNQKGPICIRPADTFFTVYPLPPSAEVDETPPEVVPWQLGSISPNPINSQFTISYSVGGTTATSLQLCVYDASGREVKVLASGSKAPGNYQVTWDGRDVAGIRCPAGVYFVKMSSTNFNANEKLVLIR